MRFGANTRLSGLCGLIALSLVAACGVAQAEDRTGPASTFRLSNNVKLELEGRITSRCLIGAGEAIDFGRLTESRQRQALLPLDCNVPFSLTFQSTRGALAHDLMPQGHGPFAGQVAYSIDVQLPVRNARRGRTIQQTFDGRALTGGQSLLSNNAISDGPIAIGFTTAPPTGEGLLAGDYSETLSVTVTPQM